MFGENVLKLFTYINFHAYITTCIHKVSRRGGGERLIQRLIQQMSRRGGGGVFLVFFNLEVLHK